MKNLATALILFALAANCSWAQSKPLALYILHNGHVRFDNGPELSEDQLLDKIRALEKQKPRPEIRLKADATAKYADVAKVLTLFQKEGYGPHFGIVAFVGPEDPR
ncbi:MAG TPA: biopolymer transporter ExbD [Rhizomicrobium sp.]